MVFGPHKHVGTAKNLRTPQHSRPDCKVGLEDCARRPAATKAQNVVNGDGRRQNHHCFGFVKRYEVRLVRIVEGPNAQGHEASKFQIPRLRNVLESPKAQGPEASKFQSPKLRNVLESPKAQGHEASKIRIPRL